MALCTKWYKGDMTPKEKQELTRTVENSRYILDILTTVIEQDIQALETTRLDDYSIPGWPYLRADRDGAVRALRNILKLTQLKEAQ